MRRSASPALLIALLLPAAASAADLARVEAAFEPSKVAVGETATLVVRVRIAEGYHAYAPDSPEGGGLPARIELTETAGGLEAAGEWTFTPPEKKWDPIFETVVHLHEGEVEYRLPMKATAPGRHAVRGRLELQICDERSCVQESHPFEATLEATAEQAAPPAGAPDPTGFSAGPFGGGASYVQLRASFDPERVPPGATARLVLDVRIAEGRHLYAPDSPAGLPARIEIDEGPVRAAGAPEFPQPTVRYSEVFEADEHLLEGEVRLVQPVKVPADTPAGPVTVRGRLTGQTCDEDDCLAFEVPFEATLTVDPSAPAPSPPPAPRGSSSPPADSGQQAAAAGPYEAPSGQDLERMPLSAFLALAVFWGIVTLLMPCTYPMIPITISFFTKQSIAREGRVLGLSLAYGLGIVAVFVLIGALLGAPIIAFAQHPVTNLVIGLLFLYFALVLFGVVDLQPPRFLLDAAGRAGSRGGYVGVFLMGATLVVTSFTCTAPFVGSLLSVGASDRDLGRIVLGMAVFGLTMAVPFVLLSLLPARLRRLPQAGDWMNTLKVYLGFIEFAAALKFFSNADLVWNWRLLPREVFLGLWSACFFAGAAYLFGWIRLRSEAAEGIGPGRMLGGLVSLLLSAYFSLGVFGYVLDDVTTAIAPNYSNGRVFGQAASQAPEGHVIVKDELEAARERALREGKLLLVNFTGFS